MMTSHINTESVSAEIVLRRIPYLAEFETSTKCVSRTLGLSHGGSPSTVPVSWFLRTVQRGVGMRHEPPSRRLLYPETLLVKPQSVLWARCLE